MSNPNQYLVDALKKLGKQLSEIKSKLFSINPKLESSDTPKQYSFDAVQTDTNPGHKARNSEPMIRARLNLPQPIHIKDDTEQREKRWFKDRKFILQCVGVLAAVVYAAIAYLQWQDAHQAMLLTQRAWVDVVVPPIFSLDGASIPVAIKIVNSGRTPALQVEGDVVATVLKRGERAALGDFSVGHPHNRLYAGAIFPESPIPATINIVQYGPAIPVPIVPDDALRQDIANGNRLSFSSARLPTLMCLA